MSAFLDVLVPSVDKVRHDHSYSKLCPREDVSSRVSTYSVVSTSSIGSCDIPTFTLSNELHLKCAQQKATLNVSMEERKRIEIQTREQSSSSEWFSVIKQNHRFQMLENLVSEEEKCISDCLYPKPLDPPPKPIAWGQSYESVAI